MKLRYTPESLCDLQEIKRYIKSELHNPTAASRITKAILDGCAQLKQFPEMGVSIGAKTGYETDLRMLVVESYIALYRIETETVSVGRIINARQDYIRILLGDRRVTFFTRWRMMKKMIRQRVSMIGTLL